MRTDVFQITAELESFIFVTEMAEGAPFADSIFRRKYESSVPRHGHHLLAWYRTGKDFWIPVSYLNYLPFRDAMLIGGACTDGQILRSMSETERQSIKVSNGLMLQLVRYGEEKFETESVGTFGYCGDSRSWSVLAQCGFVRLDDQHLIVRWNRQPPESPRVELFEAVKSLGPF